MNSIVLPIGASTVFGEYVKPPDPTITWKLPAFATARRDTKRNGMRDFIVAIRFRDVAELWIDTRILACFSCLSRCVARLEMSVGMR